MTIGTSLGDNPHSCADGGDRPHDPKLNDIEYQFGPHSMGVSSEEIAVFEHVIVSRQPSQDRYKRDWNDPRAGQDICEDQTGDLRRRI